MPLSFRLGRYADASRYRMQRSCTKNGVVPIDAFLPERLWPARGDATARMHREETNSKHAHTAMECKVANYGRLDSLRFRDNQASDNGVSSRSHSSARSMPTALIGGPNRYGPGSPAIRTVLLRKGAGRHAAAAGLNPFYCIGYALVHRILTMDTQSVGRLSTLTTGAV